MISVVGLGNAASKIAEKFKSTKNYNVYQLGSDIARNSKYKYKLKTTPDRRWHLAGSPAQQPEDSR